jgi:hypothetical protein
MQYDFLSVRCNYSPKCVDRFFLESIYINKVLYHFDLLLNLKMLISFISQVVRYRGDSVTFIDRERNNRGEGLISADQGDIRAMKSCNYRDFFSLLLQDFFCHIRRRSMWYSIMNMQKINLIVHNNINHRA